MLYMKIFSLNVSDSNIFIGRFEDYVAIDSALKRHAEGSLV